MYLVNRDWQNANSYTNPVINIGHYILLYNLRAYSRKSTSRFGRLNTIKCHYTGTSAKYIMRQDVPHFNKH